MTVGSFYQPRVMFKIPMYKARNIFFRLQEVRGLKKELESIISTVCYSPAWDHAWQNALRNEVI